MDKGTASERRKGKGAITGADGVKTRFTKDRQPSSEAKRKGWSKKKQLKDLLGIVTGAKFEGSAKDYRKLAANFFGIREEDVTVKMVMDFRQIEKAILKGDTGAYNAINDRAYGKAPIAINGGDGAAIPVKIVFEAATGCEPIPDDDNETTADG
jgi:hypothetical protein